MDTKIIIDSVVTISSMGLLLGIGLGYAGKKFEVEEDPKLALIKEALPGANCGGCGFAGCEALANAILKGEAKMNACPVGGADTVEKIADILGVQAEMEAKKVAFVKCNGGCSNSNYRYTYSGLQDCKAAMQLAGGGAKSCTYGCLGEGSCVAVCAFDAIHVVDGVAVVDEGKCTSCGMCVDVCPKKLINIVPEAQKVRVLCNSKDNGKVVRANCSVGCIGCKMCEKACQYDAVHVNAFLAQVDYEKCTMCNECTKKCPTKVIKGIS